jgi:hypothetical protein
MITTEGYSKDISMIPEGLAVTFGKDMIETHGGLKLFLKYFTKCINDEDSWWLHKCKNRPQFDVAYVYIILANRLYGRVNFGGYEKGEFTCFKATGEDQDADWNRILLVGPLIRCPFKRKLKGFQGFRYTTKLF